MRCERGDEQLTHLAVRPVRFVAAGRGTAASPLTSREGGTSDGGRKEGGREGHTMQEAIHTHSGVKRGVRKQGG